MQEQIRHLFKKDIWPIRETTQGEIDALERKLDRVAANLGREGQALVLPPWGFLREPLSDEQRQFVDEQFTLPVTSLIEQHEAAIGRNIPIHESGEPMVSLIDRFTREGIRTTFSSRPFHQYCGEWAGKPRFFWARQTVVDKIARVGKALNSINIGLRVEDAFRPEGVQEGLFQRTVARVTHEFPGWSDEEILQEARAKTAAWPWNAGHKAGAALDIMLYDLDTNRNLPIGNDYIQGGALPILLCPYLTFEEWSNRQLFAQSMRMEGMSVYPGEDWHVSYGDLLALLDSPDANANPVLYGPIKGFNSSTGNIIPYSADEYYKHFQYTIDRTT